MLVQASIRNRNMTEPFEFVSEMQHAELEINDHRVISRAMKQRFRNLIFERLLPPFQIRYMI